MSITPFKGASYTQEIVLQTAAQWEGTPDFYLQAYQVGRESDTGLAKSGPGLWGDLSYTSPKVYVALVTQIGTDAPISTIISNTLGVTPTWDRPNDPGDYNLNAPAGTFPVDRTFINGSFGQNLDNSTWLPFLEFQDPGYLLTKYWKMGAQFGAGDGSQCALYCITADGTGTADLNGTVGIRIEVYP